MIKLVKNHNTIKEAVLNFNQKQSPNRNMILEYFDYRFEENPFANEENSSVFAIENNEVIGQILLMNSEIRIKNETKKCVWGMDYVVSENHRRGPTGVGILRKAIKDSNHIGYGLSEESLKVHLALKADKIAYYQLFFQPRIKAFYKLSKYKLFKTSTQCSHTSIWKEHIGEFLLSKDANFRKERYNNYNYIEPIRSIEFIHWRYFYKEKKYAVYFYPKDSGQTYFTVRIVDFKGLKVLLLLDYRFKELNEQYYRKTVNAVIQLTDENNLDGIVTSSSIGSFSNFLKRKLFIPSRTGEIVSNFITKQHLESCKGIMITLADSDGEFYFSQNPWCYT